VKVSSRIGAQHGSTVRRMRAVFCSSFGPLEGLTVEERPSAPVGANEVRVQVTAAGVNFVDGLFVQGAYQIKPPLPFVPGNEVAGVITEVGSAVRDWEPGDRVFTNVGLGGYASEAVVDARRLMSTPGALTDGQAATFTQSYSTAWFALHVRARVTSGHTILVLGAGGGVGLAAVDVAHDAGLRVVAAASTAEKLELARSRGAEWMIDSSTEDVKARARELVGGDGVDLVYDPVGGSLGESALRALGEDGQFLVIGFASGTIPQLPANQVLQRNRRVVGVDWGAWVGRHPRENHELLRSILEGIEHGRLHPVEPTSYPLDQAAQALRDQLDRKVTGKAVLVP
jgi:NADPH2:quinone reductase